MAQSADETAADEIDIREHVRSFEVFEASWPHVQWLVAYEKPSRGERIFDYDRHQRNGERASAAKAWIKENLTDYEIFGFKIGIRCPNEAFWHRMTWH